MKEIQETDVLIIQGEAGDELWLSEKAENRLGWILTGAISVAMLPVFILPFLM